MPIRALAVLLMVGGALLLLAAAVFVLDPGQATGGQHRALLVLVAGLPLAHGLLVLGGVMRAEARRR
ncbi:hypothetical protein [Nocardioides bruguierae]|uniref:Uncharacterized protein n=1 Tax=Nocardioides bruguierae TaxID=2945102 RepID=A0A9X2DAV6_9ACTN|nr:hypothetical protein [Nocardioides bruguierae]MCM0622473.1 hypothetical protein [Nocardioides bruguierae]